jgi:hypothetical protein
VVVTVRCPNRYARPSRPGRHRCQQPDGVWSFTLPSYDTDHDDGPHGFLRDTEPTKENVAKLKALCQEVATPFAQHLLTADAIYESFFRCTVRVYVCACVPCVRAPCNSNSCRSSNNMDGGGGRRGLVLLPV